MEALLATSAFIAVLIVAAVWLWRQLKRASGTLEEARPLDIPDTRALHIETRTSDAGDHHYSD